MPQRTDIHKVLIIGSGPIIIWSGLRIRLFRHSGLQGIENWVMRLFWSIPTLQLL